jgi:carbamate kinase
MLVVAALGGNALLRRGEPLTATAQRRNARAAARAVAALADAHDLVITHGNEPQVGMLAEVSGAGAWPLDVVGAETEGMIGYMLEQELRDVLPDREIATLLTQTIVHADDPAFATPARELVVDGGVRRVVPSPEPREVLGLAAVRALLDERMIVICAGGGGVPVIRRSGRLTGVEAVIDKDLAAALLARSLPMRCCCSPTCRASSATRAPSIPRSCGRPAPAICTRSASRRARWARRRRPPLRFAAGGGLAAIGALDDARAVLAGTAGTQVMAPAHYAPTPGWPR